MLTTLCCVTSEEEIGWAIYPLQNIFDGEPQTPSKSSTLVLYCQHHNVGIGILTTLTCTPLGADLISCKKKKENSLFWISSALSNFKLFSPLKIHRAATFFLVDLLSNNLAYDI